MNEIQDFIEGLKRQSNTDTVFNPYRAKSLSDNLKRYLEYMCCRGGKRILLVGEAPGYKGCRLTGVPFTSGALFRDSRHPLIADLAPRIHLSGIEAENTARIVWQYLESVETIPMFWNSFPFHPHVKNRPTTNRKPTKREVETGAVFLRKLSSIYLPEVVAGIGRSGAACAEQVFPDAEIVYIRHPSFGGKKEFIRGMNAII